jgi:tetratricopeptide (TPR) repeat protein
MFARCDWPKRLCAAVGLGLALCGCRPPGPNAAPPPRLLSTYGPVADLQTDGDWIAFRIGRSELRFVLSKSACPDAAELATALQSAANERRSVQVRYVGEDGYLSAGGRTPTYLVHALVVQGRTLRGMSAAAGYAQDIRRSAARPLERALLRGTALYYAGDYPQARAALDMALEDAQAERALRALAFELRGRVREAVLEQSGDGATLAGDMQRLAALQDYRAWAALEPGSARPRYAIAGALAGLGAYDEALDTYAGIRREWLDEDYWTALRISAVHRERGDLPQALAVLDELAASDAPPDGMPYHYHRGWALLRLERYGEAAAEFTAGMPYQPDYPWALLRRACADAMQGELAVALADQERGLALLRAAGSAPPAPPELAVLKHAEAVAGALRDAQGMDRHGSSRAPCEPYPGESVNARERSPLLPVAATP